MTFTKKSEDRIHDRGPAARDAPWAGKSGEVNRLMAESLRLFVALELPAPVLRALEAVQERLRADAASRAVRWTRPEGIHLTLKFLGDTPADDRDAIAAALREAVRGHAPLTLRAEGLGCFPNPGRPRVVWVGLTGDLAPLEALQRSVEAALEPLGFPAERRGFSPHLTLGRARREAATAEVKALGRLIAATAVGEIGAWTADSVSLMRSELRPDGARYTCLASVPLL